MIFKEEKGLDLGYCEPKFAEAVLVKGLCETIDKLIVC